MKKKFYMPFLILIFSCRKDVKLQLPEYSQKVVIEGSIEPGSPAFVFLSYSVPYFGAFDFSDPQTALIKGALVTVSDGERIDTLLEPDLANGFLYVGTKIFGQVGRTYTIKVTVNKKTFITATSILNAAKLDTIFFEQVRDSVGNIAQVLKEPAGSGDCYRWFAKRLNRDPLYAAPFNSVFEDKFIDGKNFEFSYSRGRQPSIYATGEDSQRGLFKLGDTVVVKFCKIGRSEYDFWNTYYQNKSANNNPFSAPANIKSMFNDYENAFGAFVGYAPAFDTVILR